MANWYRKLKTPSSRAARLRCTAQYHRRENTRNKQPPLLRETKLVFYKGYCKSLYLNGRKIKVVSRYHIAKYFNLPLSTVLYWDEAGALPEPFMQLEGPRGPYPVFLASQLRVLRIVLADLVQDGYVSIPWSRLSDHVAMLHDGYREAVKRFVADGGMKDEEPTDRFGNIFFD